jgi:hypothetical protein
LPGLDRVPKIYPVIAGGATSNWLGSILSDPEKVGSGQTPTTATDLQRLDDVFTATEKFRILTLSFTKSSVPTELTCLAKSILG